MIWQPLVSIIIPVYNGENYLRNAIDSALAQTYKNCEIIVVNDGSTDDTEEICQSYGNKIRYFLKENGGAGSAVNLGIKNMRGEYFSWLSHDDMYYPHKVEAQINALRDNGNMTAHVYADCDIIDMNKKQLVRRTAADGHLLSKLTDSIYPLLYGVVNGNTVMLHNSAFDKCGCFNPVLKTTQDYDMWFRAFRGLKLVYINMPLAKYRIHDKQTGVIDKNHITAQEELRMGFYNSLTENEINRMFGSRYNFHYEMAQFDNSVGFKNCALWNWTLFFAEKEPVNAEKLRRQLKTILTHYSDGRKERIIIFGAGCRGRQLYFELCARNINVSAFVDNLSIAETVCGIPCTAVSYDSIHDSLIIISPEYGAEQIRSQLVSFGCLFWIEYSEIMRILRQVPADRQPIRGCVNV